MRAFLNFGYAHALLKLKSFVQRPLVLKGMEAAKARVPAAAVAAATVLVTYTVLHALKKRRIFFYAAEAQGAAN